MEVEREREREEEGRLIALQLIIPLLLYSSMRAQYRSNSICSRLRKKYEKNVLVLFPDYIMIQTFFAVNIKLKKAQF